MPTWLRLLYSAPALIASCGSPGQPAEPTRAACAEPTSPSADTLEHTPSLLSARFTVTKRRLQRELTKRIPVVLARESGRSIGAPGRLSYIVKRNAFEMSVKHDVLSIRTRMTGDISICKPLGPVCVGYGKCRPSWLAQVTLPLEWHNPPAASTTVQLERGCTLSPVGLDATEEVRKVTRRETQKVREQVNRELKRGQQQLLSELKRLFSQNELGSWTNGEDPLCVGVDEARLRYTAAEAKDGESISGVVQLEGQVHMECGQRPPPPVPQYASTLDGETHLSFSAALSFKDIEDQLSKRAAGQVRLRSVGGRPIGQQQAGNLLYVGVPDNGACGVRWHRVQPTLTDLGLLLQSVDPEAPEEWRSGQLVEKPAEFSALEHGARKLLSNREQLVDAEKRYDLELKTPGTLHSSVRVGQQSISLVLTMRGATTLTAL